MTKEQKDLANSLKWWHKIKLSEDYTTPGLCAHTADEATSRFGMPEDLSNKRVLDIGAWDGLFSFEAEKRGGNVAAIDIYQNCFGQESTSFEEANKPFQLARKVLNSHVGFFKGSIERLAFTAEPQCDVALFYGVLYHLENPLGAIRALAKITAEMAIIETTYAKDHDKPVLEYRPGHENDETNQFYPSLDWLELALKKNGFKRAELHWSDNYRCTIKAYK